MLLGMLVIVLNVVGVAGSLARDGKIGSALAGAGIGFLSGLYGSIGVLLAGGVTYIVGRALAPAKAARRGKTRVVVVRERR